MLKPLIAFAALAFGIVSSSATAPHAPPELTLEPSAVKINVTGGHGSGVYLGNGYVLTARHVTAEASNEVEVETEHGTKLLGHIVWEDKVRDFALVRIPTTPAVATAKLACRSPLLAEVVTVAGWPADLGYILTTGPLVGAARRVDIWETAWVFTVPIFGGNSGGPAYDHDGKVLGLVVGMLQNSQFGLMIPLEAVCAVLPSTVLASQ